MKHWNRYLDTALYGLVLLCVVVVSLAFWPPSHRPFETVKGLLFHSFALMACFLVLARAFHTKTLPFPRDLLSGLVCLYLGYNLLSFALSPFADRSYFLDLVFLIVFFFSASAAVDSVGRYGGLLYAVALLVLISTIYAILQSFGIDYQPFLNRFGERALGSRIFSFFGNPNFFAAVLAVNLPLLLAGFFTNTGRGKALFGTSLAGAVLGLLLSASRAALLGSMVAVVLFFGLTLGRSGRKRYLWLVSTTAALLIGGFIFTASVKETGIGRLEIRQLWWDSALRIASDHPLFGTGVGIRIYITSVLYSIFKTIDRSFYHDYYHSLMTSCGMLGVVPIPWNRVPLMSLVRLTCINRLVVRFHPSQCGPDSLRLYGLRVLNCPPEWSHRLS